MRFVYLSTGGSLNHEVMARLDIVYAEGICSPVNCTYIETWGSMDASHVCEVLREFNITPIRIYTLPFGTPRENNPLFRAIRERDHWRECRVHTPQCLGFLYSFLR